MERQNYKNQQEMYRDEAIKQTEQQRMEEQEVKRRQKDFEMGYKNDLKQ